MRLKSNLAIMSASILNKSALLKTLAERDTSSLAYGTWYVSSYLAAINREAAPTSCSYSFLTLFTERYRSMMPATINRVCGNILNLRCTSSSQSSRIVLMLPVIYFPMYPPTCACDASSDNMQPIA